MSFEFTSRSTNLKLSFTTKLDLLLEQREDVELPEHKSPERKPAELEEVAGEMVLFGEKLKHSKLSEGNFNS